jgi:hypothetical protein
MQTSFSPTNTQRATLQKRAECIHVFMSSVRYCRPVSTEIKFSNVKSHKNTFDVFIIVARKLTDRRTLSNQPTNYATSRKNFIKSKRALIEDSSAPHTLNFRVVPVRPFARCHFNTFVK